MDKNLLRSFLSIVGGRFGVLFVGILTTPILVRLLSSDGYGNYAFITSALSVIYALTAKDGVTSSVRKFIVEDHEDIDQWSSKIFAFYFYLSGSLTVFAAAILYIISGIGIIEHLFGEKFTTYVYLAAILLVFNQLFRLVRSTLIAFDAEIYSEPLTIFDKMIFAFVGISLVYFGWGVDGALSGRVAGAGLTAFCCIFILSRYIDLSILIRPDFKELPTQELLSFNFATLLLVFLSTSLYNVDILMLQPLVGSSETGYYRAALVVAEFLWFVPHAAQIALLHSMSERWDRGAINEISEMTSDITRYTLLFTVLLIVGLVALAEPFVTLYYGADFEPAVLPLLLLLPGVLGFAVARPIKSTAHASGQLRHLIFATGSAAIINLILNALLIPSYGMYGAAVATSIGYGSMLLFHSISARRIGFNPLQDLRVGKITICGVVTASTILPLSWSIDGIFFPLIIIPPIGLVTFIIIALLTGAISKSELTKVRKELSRRMDR